MAGVSFYSIREIRRSRALITDSLPSLSDYVKKGEEDEIIIREDLAVLIDAFGSRIAKSLKMSFLQGLGANAKIEKGLKGAMASDIIDNKMPIINLIGEVMGFNTKQYISKHPEAIGQLMQMAGPLLPGFMKGQQNNPQDNGGTGYG